jgi:3-hydroxyisobutyrate dehydrogenase
MADTRVTVVGLGAMGSGMAHRLMAAGFDVAVYNRTREKAEALVAGGARLADSAEAAADADVLVLSLADEEAVDEVLFCDLVTYLKPGTIVVDTSTVSPSYSRNAAMRLTASGVPRVEACVIGNPQMASAGELRVFAAGAEPDVTAAREVLAAIGRQGVRYLGETGRASAMKLSFNLLLGLQTAALAETVQFAEALGLDREALLTAIVKSGWRSPVLNFRAEFMRTRRYRPAGFRATLMAKDLRLAAEESTARGIRLPLLGRVEQWFAEAVEAGSGDQDAAVLADLPPGAPR